MYRDDTEALRARVDTLEAQVIVEARRREAAEAEAHAARVQLREAELAVKHTGLHPRIGMVWPVLFLTLLGTISTFYLGRSWSSQWQLTRQLHRETVRLRHEVKAREALFFDCERARHASAKPAVVSPIPVATKPSAHPRVFSATPKTSPAGPVSIK